MCSYNYNKYYFPADSSVMKIFSFYKIIDNLGDVMMFMSVYMHNE